MRRHLFNFIFCALLIQQYATQNTTISTTSPQTTTNVTTTPTTPSTGTASTTQNQTNTTLRSTTTPQPDSNESDSSNESSSSSSSSESQESSQPSRMYAVACINARLVRFLQIGLSFNDDILQCTPSLNNLGDAVRNRLADYNLQFDDLSATYAMLVDCITPLCRVRVGFNLIADIAQIAADLNAIQVNLGADITPKTTISQRFSSSSPVSTTSVPLGGVNVMIANILTATERRCIGNVVNNVVNAFNNISACV